MSEEVNTDFVQVIQEFDDKVRVFKVLDYHIGDEDDPLTTFHIDASEYFDVDTKERK